MKFIIFGSSNDYFQNTIQMIIPKQVIYPLQAYQNPPP